MSSIYLDHAATSPLRPQVLEAMTAALGEWFGNPSSIHAFGRDARRALTEARDCIARALGCKPGQLIFTSGGTESDNLAVIGTALKQRTAGKTHIITTKIEHHAVLGACRQLEKCGFDVTWLPADSSGKVDPDDVARAFRSDTALVSVMYGNNETGAVQPVEAIGRLCRERGVPFHVDAVQALGSVPLHLSELPFDLVSFSAHKINGPKGIGLLYVADGVPLQPLLFGGNQERRRRPGTENVPAAVGFAKAVELAALEAPDKQRKMRELRELFVETLRAETGGAGVVVNGHPEARLEHIVNVSFPGIDKETMLMNLDLAGIAASGGSACTSGSLEDSHVLEAMGLAPELVRSAIRFSFGYGTTAEEVAQAAKKTGTIANRLRNS
jgi:cysteine desulfurase